MTDARDYNEWIEAYYDHSIIEVERKALEKEAEHDPFLAKKLRLQRESLMAFELLYRAHTREAVQKVLEELKAEKQKKRRLYTRIGAATLALAAVISLLAIYTPLISSPAGSPVVEAEAPRNTKDPATLAVAYFEPLSLELSTETPTSNRQLAENARTAFANAEYAQAVPLLKQLLDKDTERSDASLALALSYMALDSTHKAARQFVQLIKDETDYSEQARWYLSLAYFRHGMIIQAIGLMEEIARTDAHFQQTAAIDFLKQMKGETENSE